MLKNLLREIQDKGAFSKAHISQKLDISEDLVEDMLEQLIRMGYLDKKETDTSCDISCGSCPYANSCNKEILSFYSISEKGKNLLNR